jgi:hypothetical protein
MKVQAFLAATVLAALVLASCTLSKSESGAVIASVNLSALVKAVNSIPGPKGLLPSSLLDATSPTKKGLSRAIGDVATLDPTALAGVRSEGYVRMQKEIAESVLANIMTAFQSGLTTLGTLGYDSPVALGNVTLTLDQAAILGVPQMFDAGKALAHQNTDGSVDVKWHFSGSGHFRLPNSTAAAAAGAYDYYLHLVLTSVDTPANLTAAIAFYGTQILDAQTVDGSKTYPQGTKFTVSIRGKYDAAAGSQIVLFDPVTNTSVSSANQTTGRYEAVTVSSGETSYLAVAADGFNAAWGDATRGGVLAKGVWSDVDAAGNPLALNQYRSEVYNGTGELVKEKVASDAQGSLFAFLKDLDNGVTADKKFVNLADYPSLYSGTPPDSFLIKAYESWDTSGARSASKLQYSTDGTSWTTFFDGTTSTPATFTTLVPWIVTYRTGSGTGEAAWQTGDRVYFTSDSDGSQYNAGAGYTVYSYQLDFRYNAPSAQFTGDLGTYYVHNSFPLKTLRLSSTLAARNYVIEAKETGSVTEAAQDGTSYSAPRYQFWLQKPDGASSSVVIAHTSFSPGLGDLEVSNALHQKEFWVWNPAAQTRSNVQSYVVTTTAAVPPAFQLADAALGTDITAVETALGAQATTALAKQSAGLTQTALDTAAASLGVTAIQSADLSAYPSL